jgi:hypothetical protein
MSDYTDRIGTTRYELMRTDSQSHSLHPREECGPRCPSIDRNIDRLRWNESAIAVRRQVVKDYLCDEGFITSQYLNLYQHYVIVLASDKLLGPMSVAEYRAFRAANPTLLEGIELLEDANDFDGRGEPLSSLDHCTNPKPR